MDPWHRSHCIDHTALPLGSVTGKCHWEVGTNPNLTYPGKLIPAGLVFYLREMDGLGSHIYSRVKRKTKEVSVSEKKKASHYQFISDHEGLCLLGPMYTVFCVQQHGRRFLTKLGHFFTILKGRVGKRGDPLFRNIWCVFCFWWKHKFCRNLYSGWIKWVSHFNQVTHFTTSSPIHFSWKIYSGMSQHQLHFFWIIIDFFFHFFYLLHHIFFVSLFYSISSFSKASWSICQRWIL